MVRRKEKPKGAGPGPVPKDLDNEERAEFLRLIRGGYGRQMTLVRMKIGYRRFRRVVREDRTFLRAIVAAETYRDERLHAALYARAMGVPGDPEKGTPDEPPDYDVAMQLLKRSDLGKRFAAEMAQRRREAEAQANRPSAAVAVSVNLLSRLPDHDLDALETIAARHAPEGLPGAGAGGEVPPEPL